MPATKTLSVCLFLLLVLLHVNQICLAQPINLDPDKWAVKLSKNELNEVNSLGSLTKQLMEADTLRALRFLDSLQASDNAKGYFFRTYFCMVKAGFLYARFAGYDKYKDRRSKELQPIKEQVMKLYADALDAAYHTENELAIGWVCFYSARRIRNLGETAWAVMYSKGGVDIFEKVGYDVEPPVYTELAELLYQVREYDECITYAKKGIAAWKKYEKEYKDPYKYKVRALNTIGMTFYKKNQYDSANAYYQQALQLAKKNKDTLWTGKVLGNIGRIIYAENKFDSSYLLFKTDYETSKVVGNYDDAANASEWAARADLARGNKIAALAEAREAIRLLKLWPNGPYLRDTYYTFTQIFRAMGNYDSAFYYSDSYMALNDSIEKEVATSSLAISKARLNDETSRYNIQKLNRERKAQLQLRNSIIAFIVLASIVALLYVNKLRVKHIYKEELALQQKKATELLAREQLQLVTQNLIEKTGIVEELQRQLNNKMVSAERQELATTISNLTILTEADWEKFKSLFEQLHPGFFINLQEKVSDITIAELRMAALTRLHLATNQIASILGISSNSVYKTKQRLRQRLNIDTETSIEQVIANI